MNRPKIAFFLSQIFITTSLLTLPLPMSSDTYFPTTGETIQTEHDMGFCDLKLQVVEFLANSWCSREKAILIMDLIYQTKPRVCVEIGTFTGSSLLPIATSLKYAQCGHVFAIEPWSNQEAVKCIPESDNNYPWWSTVEMSAIKKQCQQLIQDWNISSVCKLIEKTSSAAVNQFLEGEIDFLHIDGNFSEEGALEDVKFFLPKVKPGGYILLSNLFQQIDGKFTKLTSMWMLYDNCDVLWNEEHNTVLFQKH